MAIHREIIVDIPEHSYLQRKGGREYVYMYTKFFRRPDGKPSNKSMAVGMLTSGDDWVMHPNDNYLRMNHITIDPSALTMKPVGRKTKRPHGKDEPTSDEKVPVKMVVGKDEPTPEEKVPVKMVVGTGRKTPGKTSPVKTLTGKKKVPAVEVKGGLDD